MNISSQNNPRSLPLLTGSGQREARGEPSSDGPMDDHCRRLTCSETQPEAADVVVVEPVVVPHRDLGAGLPQVLRAEAVVHHGVVEHGVGRALHHAGLLPALLAGVRKYSAAAVGGEGMPV